METYREEYTKKKPCLFMIDNTSQVYHGDIKEAHELSWVMSYPR